MLSYLPQRFTSDDDKAGLLVVAPKVINIVQTMHEFGETSLFLGSTDEAHVILSLSTSADPEQVKPLHCSILMFEGGLSLTLNKSRGRVFVNNVALGGTHILTDGDLVELCGSSSKNEYSIWLKYKAFRGHDFKSLLTSIREKNQADAMEQEADTPTPAEDVMDQVSEEEEGDEEEHEELEDMDEDMAEDLTQPQHSVIPLLSVRYSQLEERVDGRIEEVIPEPSKSSIDLLSQAQSALAAPVTKIAETSSLVFLGASAAVSSLGLTSASGLAT